MKFYKYLNERESTDREFRNKANIFLKKVVKYLNKYKDKPVSDVLMKSKDGYVLDASDIDKDYTGLYILFNSNDDAYSGGFGKVKNKNLHVIVLPIMNTDNDSCKQLANLLKIMKNRFLHEIIHYYDSERYKGDPEKSISRLQRGGRKAYYNNPSEFNAYYQEGVSDMWDLLDKLPKDKRAKILKIKTFKEFFKWVERFDGMSTLINNLEGKWKTKLIKRLTDLHREVVKEIY